MKFSKWLLWSMILVFAASVALAGCGGSKPAADTGKKIKIGVAMKTEMQPRWRFEVKTMTEEAQKLGAEIIVQWANDDLAKQTQQVETLLSQGINVLILNPVNDNAAAALVKKAKQAGVPVVAYNQAIPNSEVDYYVTRDDYKVGQMQVQAALRMAPKGNYVLVKGDPANDIAKIEAEEWEKALKPYVDKGDIKIVSDQWHKKWSPETALNQAENSLSANKNNVAAFLVGNDGMATGVVQAIKAQNLQGKVFVSGMNGDLSNCRLIVEGLQTMTVWTPIDEMAKKALNTAFKLAKKEAIQTNAKTNNGLKEVPTDLIPVVELNKDNMAKFVDEIAPKGWVSKEEVYKNVPAPGK